MAPRGNVWLKAALALALVVQGVTLLDGGRVGGPGPWHGIAVAVALPAAWLLMRASSGRRRAWAVALLAAQLALAGLAGVGALVGRGDDPAWAQDRRQALAPEAARLSATVPRLTSALDSLLVLGSALPADDDPFANLAAVESRWADLVDLADREHFVLAAVLWERDARVGWTAGAFPFPPPAADSDSASIQRGTDGWYLRRQAPLPGDGGRRLELQLLLAEAIPDPGAPPVGWYQAGFGTRPRLRADVAAGGGRQPGRWRGDAQRGLTYAADLPLPGLLPGGEAASLRLVLDVPPRALADQRTRARIDILRNVLVVGAAAAFGAALGWLPVILVGLWAGRLLWAGTDLFHALLPAFSGPRLPPRPVEAASLVDPAYFATRWGAGLYASTADALATGLLVLLTVWILSRHRFARVADDATGASASEPGPGRFGARLARSLFFAAAGVVLFLGLHALADEFVANANARLIGPKAPLTFVTFWGLHLALLLHAVAAGLLLQILASRLHRRLDGPAGLMVFAGALAAAVALGTALAPAARLMLPVLLVLFWWSAGLRARLEPSLRQLALLLPLLLIVTWNYLGLAEAYDGAEFRWLQTRGEEIVTPQDDWVGFLMEDLLAEMAVVEPFPTPVAGAHAREADGIWRNWPAYVLWRTSGLDELDLPCLIEVLDADGATASLFASGFFRDYGYELGERSDWWAGQPVVPRPGEQLDLFLQTERRRYPTGDELVLRGEVQRPDAAGWVRLELPVQSRRLPTLLARLSGNESGGGGYLPRSDVDRPLLLLRGDVGGWRDAGGGGVPGPDAAPALAALMSGEAAWRELEVEGRRYRCVWRELSGGTAGEGFLLGIERPGYGDRLLDLSRLVLLSLLLLALPLPLLALPRLVIPGRRAPLGFQQRFLFIYLALGLLPLLLAGTFVNRLSREWLAENAQTQTREGLAAAGKQLQGLLAEQARALAGSDYIADLLASRLGEARPLGPYGVRQGMLFSGDGELMLDETLSDLDADEAGLLIATARSSPLVVMQHEGDVFLGTVVPVDLSGMGEQAPPPAAAGAGPEAPPRDGFFFYRQRVDVDLIAGLAEIVQGEITLQLAGETVLASHPERVFSGETPQLVSPRVMERLRTHPGNTSLHTEAGSRLSWTGMLRLPTLVLAAGPSGLDLGSVPASISVQFPARERDFVRQRERTVLFLAGLATLIFLTAMLLALALTWKIFDPVRVLVAATRRLAAGDYGAPLPEPGRDEVGTLSASFGAMRDDLRAAQLTLAERERFLSHLLEKVPVGVAVFDAAEAPVTVNPAAEAILADFFAGGEDGDAPMLAPTAIAALAPRLLADFRSRLPRGEGAAEIPSWDGRRTLRGRLAPLALPGGSSDTLVVFEDVTEFLANKRLALNAQLARQVAHEVKNPLTPIQLSIQFLQQAWRDGAEDLDGILESTVAQVLEQVALLRSIATEFSLLGRPESLECAPVDWSAVVREVIDRYRPSGSADAGPAVDEAGGPPPPVLAHAESLAKVMGNLMENSVQARGDAASLALRLRWRTTPDAVVLIWADNGPGLAPDVADRLFNLYFSTKSQGSGLGLSICRNLLEKMNGRIALRNRDDGDTGAEAELSLPRADAGPPEDR